MSQIFLQRLLGSAPVRLWAVAVGAHHGRPKGRNPRINGGMEALSEWAEEHRRKTMEGLEKVFGPLPTVPPDPRFGAHHSDLWLLAGLISVADWIGSNEAWFSSERGLSPDAARTQARAALRQIGWPGGKLRPTEFGAAFADGSGVLFRMNPVQQAVGDSADGPGIIVVEGPMGCGKTEAALFAAQQLIASGHQHGIYFALPTQVTSNRIYKRIERFLANTLENNASLRLAHSNAWLEDDFDLRLRPACPTRETKDEEDLSDHVQEGRSWFASAKQTLLVPYGVGTIDRALQAVVAVKHFFVRRFALAGKVVILDEVHSYDIYTGTLITALIRELVHLGCSVIILSATLTAARRRELLNAAGVTEPDPPSTYPLVTSAARTGFCRHISPAWSVKKRILLRTGVVPEAETIEELIARAEAGQQVLWIRNTVLEAQQAFRAVSAAVREGTVNLGLLHSRFPFQRRAELEEEWLERLGRGRSADDPGSILVATQVVEQSVDIDLDFIVSDLAPTDMLLQRLGRLWRHERPARKASEPVFWVRVPDLDSGFDAAQLKRGLGLSARVYAPYVLLRTVAVWSERQDITLPDDIRPLLESTYADPDPQEPEAWKSLHADLEEERNTLAANAEAATRVLGLPMLEDEEAVLTRRRGAPTTPVVLLRSIEATASGAVLTALDGSRLEISAYEWRRVAARFLHHWIVRAPRWMVPPNISKPGWLTLHGPRGVTVAVVREDGRCVFDNEPGFMSYDPRLGVFAEQPSQPCSQCADFGEIGQWNDEDEFDY